ncbi:hypothetical protein BDBG_05449 [Blastomyces gilchristii SLH14081]|uniref:Uncharacterized protein n=1 Tax=Blastomyces gilchristii (strain SLH14081) TaxID=559298 RepID=A0A179UPG7_BLAGS|nr:uncharacterized protein BDBG_05449 [Blastomyces gilchristii SLH14081]EQL32709.1 hypothetical protein BDFG_05241 [Blastomyces dermatitidis ATCC 26199]OAT09723.1 hypothetical protein BDBG_05449 [Blastomyces gilchristii SLH14081]
MIIFTAAEHYICGDEQSIWERYAQNARTPASAVANHNDVRFYFGGYKLTVLLEGKDPLWKHDLRHYGRITRRAKWENRFDLLLECFRVKLPPTASLQNALRLPYTYDSTIFLKQDVPPGGKDSVLYHTAQRSNQFSRES